MNFVPLTRDKIICVFRGIFSVPNRPVEEVPFWIHGLTHHPTKTLNKIKPSILLLGAVLAVAPLRAVIDDAYIYDSKTYGDQENAYFIIETDHVPPDPYFDNLEFGIWITIKEIDGPLEFMFQAEIQHYESIGYEVDYSELSDVGFGDTFLWTPNSTGSEAWLAVDFTPPANMGAYTAEVEIWVAGDLENGHMDHELN